MKKLLAFTLFIIFPGLVTLAQENRKVPSFEEVLSLKGAGIPIISPDGSDKKPTKKDHRFHQPDQQLEIFQIGSYNLEEPGRSHHRGGASQTDELRSG